MWTNDKHQRRCDLIDKKYNNELTQVEAEELMELTQELRLHRNSLKLRDVELIKSTYDELKRKDIRHVD